MVEVLAPRAVPLGGTRGLTVGRTLPQQGRTFVGAWCFADAYGPTPDATVMNLAPHPHTGLQTVSWLYAGELEHRDSTGGHALIRPGRVNLMTAGAGIQHSEIATADARELHGVQLWVALPETHRHIAPFFEHHVPEPVQVGAATVRVLVGELLGSRSTVTTFSGLVGAQLDLPAGARIRLPVDRAFEHALLVDAGAAAVHGHGVPAGSLGVVAAGVDELVIDAGAGPVRALLLGGVPLGEQIVMWWNFVGRSHEEIVAFREQWQGDVVEGRTAHGRYGALDHPGGPLPAPALPAGIRLRTRG